jgi:hypothetical protein
MPARFAGGGEKCTLPKVGRETRNNSGIASHVPGQPSALGAAHPFRKKTQTKGQDDLARPFELAYCLSYKCS